MLWIFRILVKEMMELRGLRDSGGRQPQDQHQAGEDGAANASPLL